MLGRVPSQRLRSNRPETDQDFCGCDDGRYGLLQGLALLGDKGGVVLSGHMPVPTLPKGALAQWVSSNQVRWMRSGWVEPGFDTPTEVALLVLASAAEVGGLPCYAVLSLPILFAAGMCLFDTLDGCFMNFALRLGLRQTHPQDLLQPHHHRPLGLRSPVHRHHRDPGPHRQRIQPHRRVLGLHAELQHQPGRIHHRRRVRHHLDHGPSQLALRRHRTRMGTTSRQARAVKPTVDRTYWASRSGPPRVA